jgi:hypothetical protein
LLQGKGDQEASGRWLQAVFPNICVNRFKEPKVAVSKIKLQKTISITVHKISLSTPFFLPPTTSSAIQEKECLKTTKEKKGRKRT